MPMGRPALTASRALWRSRELAAYKLWESRRKRLKEDDPRRAQAWRDYTTARDQRKQRDRQLKALPPEAITQVDADGIALIKREEGWRNAPYNDSEKYATTGVGHLIAKRPVASLSPAEVRKWTLTDAEVDALLLKDLDRFEDAVADTFKGAGLQATHNRFNACVSLAFNIGDAGFRKSSVAKEIKAGNRLAAADAFLLWKNPPVLLPRRQRERALFLK